MLGDPSLSWGTAPRPSLFDQESGRVDVAKFYRTVAISIEYWKDLPIWAGLTVAPCQLSKPTACAPSSLRSHGVLCRSKFGMFWAAWKSSCPRLRQTPNA